MSIKLKVTDKVRTSLMLGNLRNYGFTPGEEFSVTEKEIEHPTIQLSIKQEKLEVLDKSYKQEKSVYYRNVSGISLSTKHHGIVGKDKTVALKPSELTDKDIALLVDSGKIVKISKKEAIAEEVAPVANVIALEPARRTVDVMIDAPPAKVADSIIVDTSEAAAITEPVEDTTSKTTSKPVAKQAQAKKTKKDSMFVEGMAPEEEEDDTI